MLKDFIPPAKQAAQIAKATKRKIIDEFLLKECREKLLPCLNSGVDQHLYITLPCHFSYHDVMKTPTYNELDELGYNLSFSEQGSYDTLENRLLITWKG